MFLQPLTEFLNKKCKRCGIYEKDSLKSDDVFGEWELCPDDFRVPDGKYIYSVENEFNATFSCQDCVPIKAGEAGIPYNLVNRWPQFQI